MRRFSSKFSSRTAPREPRFWARDRLRQAAALTITSGTVAGIDIFDPSAETAGTVDGRLTIMRCMIEGPLTFKFTTNAAATAGDAVVVKAGLVVRDRALAAANLPNPCFASTDPKKEDWLWLHSFVGIISGGGPNYEVTLGFLRNLVNESGLLDIKAKRKIEEQQLLTLVLSASDFTVTKDNTVTAATAFHDLTVSVLFQRTMRSRR